MLTVLRTSIIAVPAIGVLALAGCSSGSSGQQGGTHANAAAAAAAGKKACDYTPTCSGVSLPSSTADPSVRYSATLHTSQGKIAVKLLGAKAPCTVNSFVFLANAGFWDKTQCHRISADGGLYMLQCGDPTAKAGKKLSCNGTVGSGGPGYSFADENLAGATYPAGTVAMANAGSNSNGSQFFLVFQNSTLPPEYTPFGTISASGLSVLRKVAKAGTACTFQDAGGGVPKDKIVIHSVSITQG